GEAMGRTITNGPTPVNFSDLKDFSLQSNDLRHRVGLAGERREAVESSTRAGHLEAIGGAEKDPGGVRQAALQPLASEIELGQDGAEGAALHLVHRLRGLIG